MKCPSCDLEFKSYTAVSLHFRNKHGTALELREIMRLKLIEERYEGVAPTCKCGCGETPKYYDYDRGYAEYVRGHYARVHNNWGHNEAAQKKSQAVRREMHKRGEIRIWCKGKTKETDERIAAYGERIRETFTPEKRKRYSEMMTKHRLSGIVPSLLGSQHPRWKGGTSALQPVVRSHLYKFWVYPKLKASGFKCCKCSKPGPGLEVHHDEERFVAILRKAIVVLGEVNNSPDDDFEKKSKIADWVVDYHLDNNTSGIVLCEACHKQEHLERT